jgi:hypothetical protein
MSELSPIFDDLEQPFPFAFVYAKMWHRIAAEQDCEDFILGFWLGHEFKVLGLHAEKAAIAFRLPFRSIEGSKWCGFGLNELDQVQSLAKEAGVRCFLTKREGAEMRYFSLDEWSR